MTPTDRVRTLGAILYPDFELLDLYGPLEMFGSLGESLRIVTVSQEPGPVRSAQGPRRWRATASTTRPRSICCSCPVGSGRSPSSRTKRCTSSCARARGRPR
jgi:hypothetical protein